MNEKFDYIKHYKTDAEEFDYFEERPAATAHDERRVREYILIKIPTSATTILDVGSGSAWLASEKTKDNIKVFSLDISKTNLLKAKKKIPSSNHIQVAADSFKLPFKNNSFDVVISSEVIEHVVSPQDFVRELFRVVKTNGSLIITTPYKEKIRYALCIHCNKKTPLNGHLHSFDENKLQSYFNDLSIEKIEWFTFGNKALIYFMTYVVLKFLPFTLWKIVDKLANLIWNKPVHILVRCKKKAD